MRLLSSLFIFTALVASATASEVTITRVFSGWRDAESFKRISEYFTGKENTGGATVLRTQPNQRAGFYFLVRAANSGGPTNIKVSVEVITPTDSKPKTYSFATDLKTGATVLNIGLTADDWPDAKAHPVAWKIELIAADGQLLTSEKSYLWENTRAK